MSEPMTQEQWTEVLDLYRQKKTADGLRVSLAYGQDGETESVDVCIRPLPGSK